MLFAFLFSAADLLTSNMLSFIIFELILFLVSAIFIWTGAKIAEIKKAGLMRSFAVAVILAVIVPLLLVPFSGLYLITMTLSVILTLAIIKLVFDTNWRRSLVTWIFSIIAQIIAFMILVFVLVLLP